MSFFRIPKNVTYLFTARSIPELGYATVSRRFIRLSVRL